MVSIHNKRKLVPTHIIIVTVRKNCLEKRGVSEIKTFAGHPLTAVEAWREYFLQLLSYSKLLLVKYKCIWQVLRNDKVKCNFFSGKNLC